MAEQSYGGLSVEQLLAAPFESLTAAQQSDRVKLEYNLGLRAGPTAAAVAMAKPAALRTEDEAWYVAELQACATRGGKLSLTDTGAVCQCLDGKVMAPEFGKCVSPVLRYGVWGGAALGVVALGWFLFRK
jgi:hypothetical protein